MINFFDLEARKLQAAARTEISHSAQTLYRATRTEIVTRFKSKKSKFGVKVYDGEDNSRVVLSPAFMKAFALGKTIQSRNSLIVLLPDGERLGFKRISPNNTWQEVWRRIQKKCNLASANDGIVVLFNYQGKKHPIYKFQKAVKAPKLLSIQQTATKLEIELPQKINQQMEKLDVKG